MNLNDELERYRFKSRGFQAMVAAGSAWAAEHTGGMLTWRYLKVSLVIFGIGTAWALICEWWERHR